MQRKATLLSDLRIGDDAGGPALYDARPLRRNFTLNMTSGTEWRRFL